MEDVNNAVEHHECDDDAAQNTAWPREGSCRPIDESRCLHGEVSSGWWTFDPSVSTSTSNDALENRQLMTADRKTAAPEEKTSRPISIERVARATDAIVDGLTAVLMDAVESGAGVSFMSDLSGQEAAGWWRQTFASETATGLSALSSCSRRGHRTNHTAPTSPSSWSIGARVEAASPAHS